VFNEAELKEIVPHLVAALAKAGPKVDIGLAVTGQHVSEARSAARFGFSIRQRRQFLADVSWR